TPFSKKACGALLTLVLLGRRENGKREFSEALQRLAEAPVSSWRRLEAAGRRENDRSLIARGLYSLRERDPAFTLDAFETCPGSLFTAAYWLGILPPRDRRQLLEGLKARRPPAEATQTWPLDRWVRHFDEGEEGAAALVPRALRGHLEGRKRLSPAQLEGHRRRLLRRLAELGSLEVREGARQALAASVPGGASAPAELHALALLRHAEGNRRGLRRLIEQRLAGGKGAEADHSRSRQWFERHPKVDAGRWLTGLTTDAELPDLGRVRITLERDLLEVLQMGSYVRTCLGLGGSFSYSAAAVALDVNKQVLFARDAQGKVLARQLIAVSSHDRLFVYELYPQAAPPSLQDLFLDHVRRLADHLGLPLVLAQDEDEADDEVELLLASEFWDDGLWFGPEAEPA
ncbi:MAG: hypothetical protein KDD47_21860, partial [Acidobacteria bacterium]|nr:hypothetical protein [Acidobacteriota bacterium]